MVQSYSAGAACRPMAIRFYAGGVPLFQPRVGLFRTQQGETPPNFQNSYERMSLSDRRSNEQRSEFGNVMMPTKWHAVIDRDFSYTRCETYV